MRVKYSLQIVCVCPSDDLADLYDITIESERTIKVEDILIAAEEAASMKVYQEDLTVWLARRVNARVTTVGWHYGVRTEVSA